MPDTVLTVVPLARTPDAIDVSVGARIRSRRRALGVSQESLGDALRLTFQQVQKYERGTNRVSASMLVRVAKRLETSVGHLVGEVADPNVLGSLKTATMEDEIAKFAMTFQGLSLAAAVNKMTPARRQALLNLAQAMVEDDDRAVAA